MPKFRNVTTDDRWLPWLDGLIVEAGAETPDLTKEQAAGLALQEGVWEAVTVTTTKNSNAKETD